MMEASSLYIRSLGNKHINIIMATGWPLNWQYFHYSHNASIDFYHLCKSTQLSLYKMQCLFHHLYLRNHYRNKLNLPCCNLSLTDKPLFFTKLYRWEFYFFLNLESSNDSKFSSISLELGSSMIKYLILWYKFSSTKQLLRTNIALVFTSYESLQCSE